MKKLLLICVLLIGVFGLGGCELSQGDRIIKLEKQVSDLERILEEQEITYRDVWVFKDDGMYGHRKPSLDLPQLKADFDLLVETLGYEKKHYEAYDTFESPQVNLLDITSTLNIGEAEE